MRLHISWCSPIFKSFFYYKVLPCPHLPLNLIPSKVAFLLTTPTTHLKRHRSLHPSLVITIVDILRLRTQQIITHSQTQILLLLLMHREFLHLRMLVELPHSTGLSTPTTTKLIYLSMRHGKTKTIMNFPLHKRLPAHPRW